MIFSASGYFFSRRYLMHILTIVALALFATSVVTPSVVTPSAFAQAPSRTTPLAAGATAPAFELTASDGSRVSLGSLLERGPAVVVFYRGAW
jgi:cytochrome oxidase Cu insertion factor (SCO1/SenC/PrrC family)